MPTALLHIEDNPENRLLVRALLPRREYTVLEAEDGPGGIAAALRERPALILLDIGLPEMDGYEVAAALRALPALRDTPIVAVTAYATAGDRERILAAGCDGYITKPLDADAFPRQVDEFLRGRRERLARDEELPLLRELNQRFVGRVVARLDDLRRLNGHLERRAAQLAAIQGVFQDVTADLDARSLLERVLPAIAGAIGLRAVRVELAAPFGLEVGAEAPAPGGSPEAPAPAWSEYEWKVPLVAQQREIGRMAARAVVELEARRDEEQLLKVVASHLACSLENARLYADLQQQMAALQRAQARLIQSAKLAALGQMAAQVAHEINNPLTSVLGFASMLVEQVPAGEPFREPLELIVSEAGRARDIVRDLLDFGRQRPLEPEPTDLNELVRRVLALIRPQCARIVVEEHYAADMPLVAVDAARLKQVFLNILTNAVHAMPGGGRLTVTTAVAGEEIAVSVEDTGAGIAPEHLGRIFEPFFTTRPEVSGTGLGLSVSLGIVRQHGGRIDVESERGRGSRFSVCLPLIGAGGQKVGRS